MVHSTIQISLTFVLLLFPLLTAATPAVQRRQSGITTLSPAQVASFKPYTFFASTAYCDASTTKNWTCGANCDANPGFKPIASGGNGDSIQFCEWNLFEFASGARLGETMLTMNSGYVGFDPTLKTIIVAHQGTDTSKLYVLRVHHHLTFFPTLSPPSRFTVLTDANFIPAPLNPTLFPGLPFTVLVHAGFAIEHAQTATDVLAAVQQGMSQFNTTKVTLVGHSSGAALSLLDSVYLPLHLPTETEFTSIMYGLPRVSPHITKLYYLFSRKTSG
jgi:hypothetical protein